MYKLTHSKWWIDFQHYLWKTLLALKNHDRSSWRPPMATGHSPCVLISRLPKWPLTRLCRQTELCPADNQVGGLTWSDWVLSHLPHVPLITDYFQWHSDLLVLNPVHGTLKITSKCYRMIATATPMRRTGYRKSSSRNSTLSGFLISPQIDEEMRLKAALEATLDALQSPMSC